MFAFLLILAFSLNQGITLNTNSKPCLPTNHKNTHSVFLKRHIPDGVPSTWNQNDWENFLRKIKTCGRPTQSLFRSSEKQRVESVCSQAGGKSLSRNLCISKEKFKFVTVRIDTTDGACGIRSIRNETKHIILACEEIGNVCQPVHFEGNPENTEPSNNQIDCGATGSARTKTADTLLFSLSLFVIFYSF